MNEYNSDGIGLFGLLSLANPIPKIVQKYPLKIENIEN
jgi:hypothetical protein